MKPIHVAILTFAEAWIIIVTMAITTDGRLTSLEREVARLQRLRVQEASCAVRVPVITADGTAMAVCAR